MRFDNMPGRLSLVAALAFTTAAMGQPREDLKIGDEAPGLSVDAWVQGGEITIEPGNTYVVMFWDSATSSGHSDTETVKSMNRLRRLHELYAHKARGGAPRAPYGSRAASGKGR